MSFLLTKVTFLLLPLIFWPSPLKFELAKVICFSIASFFLVISLLLKFHQETKIKKDFLSYNNTWLFWVGFLLLSTILNGRIVPGLLGNGYRYQGVLFFLALGVWMMVFEILTKKEKRNIAWWWIGMVVAIESLIILTQWFLLKLGFPILSYNARPIGTFGEPNAAAGFLVMGLPALTAFFPFYFIFLTIIAIILTGSKAGLGALLAQGIILSYLKLKIPGKKFLLILGLSIILLAGIFGVWQERNQSLFENRWLIWNLGIKAALEKPVLGYGAEGIINIYEKQFKSIDRPLVELMVDRSHNLFLDIILFSGFLGLVFFLKWFWESTKKIKENYKLAGLVGFFIFSFFQPLGIVHWVYLIFLLSS